MARVILKAPRNTPASALLGDLGWNNFKSMHDLIKVKYFSRLVDMDLYRWPKLVFNALYKINNTGSLKWKWLQSIKNTLCDNDVG